MSQPVTSSTLLTALDKLRAQTSTSSNEASQAVQSDQDRTCPQDIKLRIGESKPED